MRSKNKTWYGLQVFSEMFILKQTNKSQFDECYVSKNLGPKNVYPFKGTSRKWKHAFDYF